MKKYKWRLYADHNIEKELVEDLRSSNFDVLWIMENKDLKRQIEDSFHYNKAKRLKRYLITKDNDFWDEHKYSVQNIVVNVKKMVEMLKGCLIRDSYYSKLALERAWLMVKW